jgi:CHAT domain-containing protein
LVRVLQSLWADVVAPISEQLSTMNVPPNSRVWWCPTSSFSLLPLHAAGPYDRLSGGPFITRWVSSYTTTISDLLRSKSQRKPSINQRRLLFVGHAGGNLDAVRDEARVVGSVEGVKSSLLLEEGATADSVLKQLPDCSWVHLSCHGFAIGDRPLDSYFQLDDRDLTVQDIIESRVGNAELAFLSACHSAASGTHIPDENIHLAAALNLAGFRSIVGSLWEVWDGEGPAVSGLFYKKLMKRGGRYTDAAEALHYALLSRWKHGASLQRWAMFIHMGA